MEDGYPGDAVDSKQHTRTGPNTDRPESAHAHSINLDHSNRFAIACDLGADELFIYRFDAANGKLTPNPAQPFLSAKPGAGPRHFASHPNRRSAFVINELSSTITAFGYDAKRGKLTEIQTIPTLPKDWQGTNTCADVHISADGSFVFGSDRGHDSIVVYRFNPGAGTLELIGHDPTGGKTPRNFAIYPCGRYLHAANDDSDSTAKISIDERSVKLNPIGEPLNVPSLICLKFSAA